MRECLSEREICDGRSVDYVTQGECAYQIREREIARNIQRERESE